MSSIASADDTVLSGREWYESIEAIGAKYRRGTTQAQNNLRRKELYREILTMKAARVRMASEVVGVKWKKGIAEIQTGSFIPDSGDPKAKKPLIKIYRTAPLELRMSEEEAAAIEPGMPVAFEGTLTLQPSRHGAVGLSLKTQQMHTINHTELIGMPLGTYTSADCVISVGGKVYPNRWAP